MGRVGVMTLLLLVPVGVLMVFYLLPTLNMITSVTSFDSLREHLTSTTTWDVLWFTTWQATLSTILTFAVALPVTWALSVFRFRWHSVAQAIMVAPFVLPSVGLLGCRQHRLRWRTSEGMFGSRRGIRNSVNLESNKINALERKRVGYQVLSLRHLALGQISLPEIRAPKIPSICGLLREKLLTAEIAGGPIVVSLGPTFSKAPDCPEKVRRG